MLCSYHTHINKIKQTKPHRDTRKHLEVVGMFITWIVVMLIRVYTYVQTHQIRYINYVQVFVY